MAGKFDLITETLLKYQLKANKIYIEYLQEVINFSKLPESKKSYYDSQTFKNMDNLVKDEIYPYLLETKEFVCKEFLNRANYYNYLSESKDFKNLITSLNADVKLLYSFIDEGVIINYEKQDSAYFLLPYQEAVKSLNINIEIEGGKNYYYQLKEHIQAQNNFYALAFGYQCEKYCDGTDAENILNINEIILQYKQIVLPFDFNQVNPLYLVKKEFIEEYKKVKVRYDNNLKTIETLLKQDLENKKLYAFYYFNKFATCGDMCRGYLYVDGYSLRCSNCIESVRIVLEELTKHVEAPCGIIFTPKEKEILELILKGNSNNQIANTLIDDKTGKNITVKTVETHITNILKKTDLANKIDLITNFT